MRKSHSELQPFGICGPTASNAARPKSRDPNSSSAKPKTRDSNQAQPSRPRRYHRRAPSPPRWQRPHRQPRNSQSHALALAVIPPMGCRGPGGSARQQLSETRSHLHPSLGRPGKRTKPQGQFDMDLTASDTTHGTDVPKCLSDPRGWLSGPCMTELFQVISAGSREVIYVADMGGSVEHYMLESGGCL